MPFAIFVFPDGGDCAIYGAGIKRKGRDNRLAVLGFVWLIKDYSYVLLY